MMNIRTIARGLGFSMLLVAITCVPALPHSTPIGSVAESTNATIAGQTLFPSTLVFSGETLVVNDGAAMITLTDGSRLVFARETTASFLRDGTEVAVLLERGSLSIYHGNAASKLRVKAGDISVVPELGFKTLGQVAVLNGGIVVSSKTGMLRVEGSGRPIEVPQGRTITLQPRTERGPQVAASGGSHLSMAASWIGLGTGVLGTVVGFNALHRSNDANDRATVANQTAAAAANAAAAATQTAVTAANLASAAATIGIAASNAVGCDLNRFANSLGQPSPYTPPSGVSCK